MAGCQESGIADTSYLGLKAISNLRNGKTEPKLESVIAICVAMKLPPVVSKKLVELSGKSASFRK